MGENTNHCHINLHVILVKVKVLGAAINRAGISCVSEEDSASLRHVAIDEAATHTFNLSLDCQTLLSPECSIHAKIRDQDFMV
jgi:hypothetical protein